jgi:hypothetical protein
MPRKKPAHLVPGPDEKMVKVRLLPEHVAKALVRSKGVGIDSAGLLAALIDRWGGKDRFAMDIQQEFQCARPGSMTRQRILEMISRLCVQVTAQKLARPRTAREMSDAELLATARTLLEKIEHGHDSAPAARAPDEVPAEDPPVPVGAEADAPAAPPA